MVAMALFALAGSFMLFGLSIADARAKLEPLTIVTETGSHRFDVEIAETSEQKTIGLMFRTELGERAGMLFPYGTAQEITMWMRNTYIPLDMVFIRGDGTVHRVEERTTPMSETVIASEGDVTAVLEIAGGVAEKLKIKPGSRIEHRTFKR